jgi:hypothetical protein
MAAWQQWQTDGRTTQCRLRNEAHLAGWPSPRSGPADTVSYEAAQRELARKPGIETQCLGVASQLAGWPTPQSDDYRDRPLAAPAGSTDYQNVLSRVAGLAGWATPTGRDHKDGTSEGTVPENGLLGRQVWQTAGWSTPTEGDAKAAGSRNTPTSAAHPGYSLTDQVRGDRGTGRSGSPASTARRGALAPTFVAWMLGYPERWLLMAPTKDQMKKSGTSSRRSHMASPTEPRS